MEYPIAVVKRRLEPYYDAPRHIILFLTLVKQMILLLHAVFQGSLTLEDLQVRLRYEAPDSTFFISRNVTEDLCSSLEFNESDSNFDQPGRPLENAVGTVCKAIVRRDLKLMMR